MESAGGGRGTYGYEPESRKEKCNHKKKHISRAPKYFSLGRFEEEGGKEGSMIARGAAKRSYGIILV